MIEIIEESKLIKTRTTHHCSWCDDIIPPDQFVFSWVIKLDDIERLWVHPECDLARNREDVFEWEPGERLRGMTYEETHDYWMKLREIPTA